MLPRLGRIASQAVHGTLLPYRNVDVLGQSLLGRKWDGGSLPNSLIFVFAASFASIRFLPGPDCISDASRSSGYPVDGGQEAEHERNAGHADRSENESCGHFKSCLGAPGQRVFLYSHDWTIRAVKFV